ncbi:MAG: Fic family protein [Acidobacteriota bacterium]
MSGEHAEDFVPLPVPPVKRTLEIDDCLQRLHALAMKQLDRLEIAGQLVPSVDWFLYGFVRKEAVVSSQIEGTRSTLTDLLEYEAELKAEDPDLQDVCNVLEALAFARGELSRGDGLPLSGRLFNEMHARLMRGVRGASMQPGKVRRSQNWIGGTRPQNADFVPPPPHRVPRLLAELERYIHSEDSLPPLIRVGLVHAQFETIHPYLDGNGRLGRLLITLLLEHWGLLSKPLLYLSLFLKSHRETYYNSLNRVRRRGDWESWIDFFLEGVCHIARQAANQAADLSTIVHQDRRRLLAHPKASVSAHRLFELLPHNPIVTARRASALLETSYPSARKALAVLESAGLLKETTGRQRGQRFSYERYLAKLSEGTEGD